MVSSIIKLVTAVGAGGGIASLALWQTGQFGGVSSNTDSSSSLSSLTVNSHTGGDTLTERQTLSLQLATRKNTNEENCEVVDTIGEEVFSALGKRKSDYTTILCKDTNVDNSEVKMKDNWTGLFPNDLLLVNSKDLIVGTKFNVKTSTVKIEEGEEDDEYETTFTGSKFLQTATSGKWGGSPREILEKSITEVKVEDDSDTTQKIYLLFNS
ncbi:hypothetical protein DNK47_02700 [Mycoplasma wenyonii]|uniref:Uncharacterized protein n=1 Tax=Mycoplasma wenyonii TaxID=65123 RepID=A0A328PII4_9MOLU|nr:hypothetical protein [Mycoplasma wenyonii]RAO94883.1 hypothetical protein DNK47_02700 [Mycoplasma wenyonii]